MAWRLAATDVWKSTLDTQTLQVTQSSRNYTYHVARALMQTQTSLLLSRCGLGAQPQYPRARLALARRCA